MSTALIAFGSAVFGALAGGFAAAGGADWAQVRQIRRSARITMYEDLLPQWRPWAGVRPRMGDEIGPTAAEVLDALKRSAVLAGPTEESLVGTMHEKWTTYVAPVPPEVLKALTAEARAKGQMGAVSMPSRDAEKGELETAVRALSDHLEGLIRKRGLRALS